MAIRQLGSVLAAMLLLGACSTPSAPSPSSTVRSTRPATAVPSAAASPKLEFSRAVIASIALDQPCVSLAIGGGAVWLRTIEGDVIRIDPETNRVAATIDVGTGEFGNVAFGASGVWVTTFYEDTVSRLDPATNQVTAKIIVGNNPEGITITPEAVWVSNHRGGSLSRVDPATNTVVKTIRVGPPGSGGPKDIVIAGGDLWTSIPNRTSVVRVDPDTQAVVKEFSFFGLGGLITNGTSVFVPADDQLAEIDPRKDVVVRTFVPKYFPEAFGMSAFWAVHDHDLWRLDAKTLEPMKSWRLSESASFSGPIGFDASSIWLVADGNTLVRVDPNR